MEAINAAPFQIPLFHKASFRCGKQCNVTMIQNFEIMTLSTCSVYTTLVLLA
ncbi:MAG: hypothetical protein JWR72_561 [Flavisolibacter sp.]|nr:hypothetical protein [Flavisolibacter sp.]